RPTLCWGTAEGTALPELIDLAAATGYGAITTTPAMYFAARAAGHSDADLRARLDGHGVGVAVVDPLLAPSRGARHPRPSHRASGRRSSTTSRTASAPRSRSG